MSLNGAESLTADAFSGRRTGLVRRQFPQTCADAALHLRCRKRRPEASHCGLWPVPLDMDPVLVLAFLHEIAGSVRSTVSRIIPGPLPTLP